MSNRSQRSEIILTNSKVETGQPFGQPHFSQCKIIISNWLAHVKTVLERDPTSDTLLPHVLPYRVDMCLLRLLAACMCLGVTRVVHSRPVVSCRLCGACVLDRSHTELRGAPLSDGGLCALCVMIGDGWRYQQRAVRGLRSNGWRGVGRLGLGGGCVCGPRRVRVGRCDRWLRLRCASLTPRSPRRTAVERG